MKPIITISLAGTIILACKTENTSPPPHPLDEIKTKQTIEVAEKITLYDLSWIQGKWIDSTSFPGKKVIENWTLQNDTLVGLRGMIKGVDTTYSQTSKIFINDGNPIYLLEPEGSAFVSFKVTAYEKGNISFGNVANVAPTAITYAQNGTSLDQALTFITPAGERKFKHHFLTIR